MAVQFPNEIRIAIDSNGCDHYNDVTMRAMASQITSLAIVHSTVYSVNSPHKGSVTRKMFPFDDVIITTPRCNDTEPRFLGIIVLM